jgi:hypothetical protein
MWAQPFAIAGKIETVIGRQLRIAVGHQRRLRGKHLSTQCMEARIAGARRRERIAFEIEFHAVLAAQLRQSQHIVMPDVASVRTRMHCDAVRSSIQAHA